MVEGLLRDPSRRITSTTAVRVSACFNANAISSSVCPVFFMFSSSPAG
jgi:hypothetical protein